MGFSSHLFNIAGVNLVVATEGILLVWRISQAFLELFVYIVA